jgi:hypothetical protein
MNHEQTTTAQAHRTRSEAKFSEMFFRAASRAKSIHQQSKKPTTNMKKQLLTIAAAVVVTVSTASGQCDRLTTVTHDKFTGKSTASGADYIVVSEDGINGVAFLFVYGEKSLILSGKIYGPSACIDDKAKIYLLFTDGSRLTIPNQGKFNCDRNFSHFFFNPERSDILSQLRTKTIEALRAETAKGSVTEDVPSDKANDIRETINCLLK